jgi:hypothetical protein
MRGASAVLVPTPRAGDLYAGQWQLMEGLGAETAPTLLDSQGVASAG